MKHQEYQLKQLRKILLDETLPNAERVSAQRSIMKILGLKEKETEGECTPERVEDIIKGRENTMENKTLKETAQEYTPKRTLNVTNLDKVDLSFPIEDRTGKKKKLDAEGNETEEEFSYKVMVANGQEYRVAATVLAEIQKILKLKPEAKFVKVTSTGSGLNTAYAVGFIE